MTKVHLHELVVGDVLFVTFETTKVLPGLAADPVGYAKKHRQETIEKLHDVGLVGVPMIGLGKGNVADIGAKPSTKWRVSYGVRIKTKLDTPDAEAMRAGFPIVGILFGLAAAGVSAGFVIAAYNLTKPGSGGLKVLSNAAEALKGAAEGAKAVGKGLTFALPVAALAALVWIWRN